MLQSCKTIDAGFTTQHLLTDNFPGLRRPSGCPAKVAKRLYFPVGIRCLTPITAMNANTTSLSLLEKTYSPSC